jgi:hypothetical protein
MDLESHFFYPENMAVHGLVVCICHGPLDQPGYWQRAPTKQRHGLSACFFITKLYHKSVTMTTTQSSTHAMRKGIEHNGIICTQSESGGLVMTLTDRDESDKGSSHLSEVYGAHVIVS